MKKLNEILDAALEFNGQDFYKHLVPAYIFANLKQSFEIRPYQKEAFGRFVFYMEQYASRPRGCPLHLLFHMATGSGKTLIMAGLMLYLYQKGYRNFLFFVDSTNIIKKTIDNFLNPQSSKYLFADTVAYAGKEVKIRQTESFQAVGADDINICFTTVQGLHSRLNTPRENSLTYDDFESQKIVLIADEAHHINSETKKGKDLNKEEIEKITNWEQTVHNVFMANTENLMLDFTATMDLNDANIAEKYNNKLLFDYTLKQFRIEKYSKEVKDISVDLEPLDRAFQSLLFSQYRRKMFEKYGQTVKPVILMKSKTIAESENFEKQFADFIKNMNVETLQAAKSRFSNETVKKFFDYCESQNISLENLADELKDEFGSHKTISVNSKNDSEEKQIVINTLEDTKNEYRVIFAVDALNEGWDVLNLFDIVRLYDTRDAGKSKIGKTTIAEAQLIGRGARYCPFRIDRTQDLYLRKYDENTTHELKICEELYYHSAYNPKYISELHNALKEIGIKADNTVQRELKLKEDFVKTNFYKNGILFKNEQIKYSNEDIFELKDSVRNQTYEINLKTGISTTTEVFTDKTDTNSATGTANKEMNFAELGDRIIRKAMFSIVDFQFDKLKHFLPNLQSTTEFITSEKYLGKVHIRVSGLESDLQNLSPKQKLDIAVQTLNKVYASLAEGNIEYKGSKEFKPFAFKNIITDKIIKYSVNETADKEIGKSMNNQAETQIYLDLSRRDWYVQTDCYGSSEEKHIIRYIDSIYDKLKCLYDEIYLVRNERHFKLYTFADGRPAEPDFVLFLINKKENNSCQYQIFIESKGTHLLEHDKWKEEFLKEIKAQGKIEQLWQGKEYNILGAPFYNKENADKETEFKTELEKEIIQVNTII